jgi:hypothetical protein
VRRAGKNLQAHSSGCGSVALGSEETIAYFTLPRLEALGEALLHFSQPTDVEASLRARTDSPAHMSAEKSAAPSR